ncbi:MAG: S-layer protein [Candidatus Aenigmarchaeota archaeon]|nr:S-layer protein [Candidatus Aenigmarchaeota archaeon]
MIVSSNKLIGINVYFGGTSSINDYIAQGGSTYLNPVFKTFGLSYPSVTPDVGGSLDDVISFRNSGDNNLQMTMTDFNGNKATVPWAYKATSGGVALTLNDTSGNAIHVVEGETVSRDQYIVLDAGGFPHMFKVSSVQLDGTSSASIDLQDVFSGTTTKVTTGANNNVTAYIDGQAYNFLNKSSTSFSVYWGSGSAVTGVGNFITVYPTLKTQRDALVALTSPVTAIPSTTGEKIQLPSGAVTLTKWYDGTTSAWAITLTATAKEDGTTSALMVGLTNFSISGTTLGSFVLGRTTTGGVNYTITPANSTIFSINATGTTGTETQPAVLIIEEKDDAGNQAGVLVPATVGSSGSNYLAGVSSPEFTSAVSSGSNAWGSNSNKASTADYWGTIAVRDTSSSAQPIADVYYPDIQRSSNVYVLGSSASVTAVGGTDSGTVQQAVPIKTSIAKLDREVTSADRTSLNLILVGGPAVNSLVAELGVAAKTWTRDQYVAAGAGTGLLDLVADAFTTGKSALVVAGYSADDTRFVTGVLQSYDTHASELAAKNRAVYKNGVISSTTA